ncbi:DUF1361 domain-containing protein [Flavobacterium sp. DGU11]|uniref:DUF1361 domain-containing protein n=1 Tax=Flavobacterium arundinis TaxID=3139143 RepID=A0ABU9I0D6_9FLAO
MKAIKLLSSQTLRQHGMLLLLTAFCFGMLLVRAKITHTIFYFFLVWNLFLAFAPFAITTLMMSRVQFLERKALFYPSFFCWLLLLPNAPYLITDFIHLGQKPVVPAWFDVLLLISFAITGLLFGITSMKAMRKILMVKFNPQIAGVAMAVVCFLSGFGVYLGRVLRYNSWDVLHRPFELIGDILYSLVAHDTWRTAWGITLGFGTLLYLLYSLSRQNRQ